MLDTMTPYPIQLAGAEFLAARRNALLADDPRCGKTGSSLIAADYVMADTILIVTTASGRPVWKRGVADWSAFPRLVQVLTSSDMLKEETKVAIVGWPSVTEPKLLAQIMRRRWSVLILDESHAAKNPEAKRTRAAYDVLAPLADKIWCLTGTVMPNSPADLYPMLNALAPERLTGVESYDAFMHHYCVVKMKKISKFRSIPVVIGGRNLPELRQRLEGFWLRRTQQDVGITEPIYETLPLTVSPAQLRDAEKDIDAKTILAAAEAGETKALEMHLGPLRRITGGMKAFAVAAAVREEFDCGLDKIVLAHWHTEAGNILFNELADFGVVEINGSTNARGREFAVERFSTNPKCRVFVGQIQAAGEAIDLSASAELLFVETTFTPAMMKQMSLRITNMTQKRQARVRVAVLEGSIDEALEAILLRKWSAIREVMQ